MESVPTAMLLCRVLTIVCLTVSASQSQGECRPIFCSMCLWPRGAWRDVASEYLVLRSCPPFSVAPKTLSPLEVAPLGMVCIRISVAVTVSILPYRQLPWPWIHANNSSPTGVVPVLCYHAQAGRRCGIFVTQLCVQREFTVADISVCSSWQYL